MQNYQLLEAGSVQQHSEGLTGLRGLAAVVVVIFHALLIFQVGMLDNPQTQSFEQGSFDQGIWVEIASLAAVTLFNGRAAVVMFFVLSGAVLYLSLNGRGFTFGRDLGSYYVRRAFRLLPVLAFVTILSAGLHEFYFPDQAYPVTTNWMNSYFKTEVTPMVLIKNMVGYSNSLNSPAWSLYVEIVASVVFPFIFLYAMRRKAVLCVLVLAAASWAAGIVVTEILFMVSFYLGAFVAAYGAAPARRVHALPGPVRAVIAAAVLLCLLTFRRFYDPGAWHTWPTVLVESSAAAILIALVLFAERPVRILTSPAVLFLGNISYSLYLIHFIVLFMLAHTVAPMVQAPLAAETALMLNVMLAISTLAVSIPLAFLLYQAVEKPFQRIGRHADTKAAALTRRLLAMAPS
jgi:peptidoglycan/LPS O-acetylase OafA/YrhL